ncbi:DMT family transporter [Bradyrhizobium jicamae]|uniref:DMT family transporter n=1 Tax=Bradyrhizobium jicamae TaxID=280332 RepID=UPI001BADB0D2|nr:DMT family transporter [Bradyrhizobium jicamae]MBR0757979.1 DMT family transporter [Bradyrhizobium jicamae]
MTSVLFGLTALLWGGGALATALQAGVTPAPWSVAIRMAVAAMCLFGYGASRGQSLVIPGRDRLFVALQGVLFFSLAFISFYEAAHRIPSGLAALVLSTSSLFAAVIGWALLDTPLSASLLWGALCGMAGVAIIFAPGIAGLGPGAGAGVAWALLAAVATGGGTVVGARNQRAGLPTVTILGWSAVVGSAGSAIWAIATGATFVPDLSVRYISSLLYLAIAASCITFALYFELVRRLGPGKAAYTLTIVPVVALLLSAAFEDLHLGANILIGAAIILVGNLIVLRR